MQFDQPHGELAMPFEGRTAQASDKGQWFERFPPYGVHVYTWGPEPKVVSQAK
jgi:hypothetical protein